jgi:hypothetical protein
LIVDYKHQDYKHLTQRQPAFKKEAAFRTRILNKEMANTNMYLPLAQNYMTLQILLAGFLFDNPAAQDYEEVGSRRPGERSESMLQSFFLCFFSSSLFSCSRTTVTATWKLWG